MLAEMLMRNDSKNFIFWREIQKPIHIGFFPLNECPALV